MSLDTRFLQALFAKHRRSLTVFAVLMTLYGLIAASLMPSLIKDQLHAVISAKTTATATFENVRFNPLSLSCTIEGFELRDKLQKPVAKLAELYLDVNLLSSLAHVALVLDQLRLVEPEIHLALLSNGQYNLSDLWVTTAQAEDRDQSMLPLLLKRFELSNGKFNWHDESLQNPSTTTLSGINLSLDNLSTTRDEAAKMNLLAQLPADGQLNDATDVTLAKQELKGSLHLQKIQLPEIAAMLLKNRVNFAIPQGDVDLNLDYQFSYKDGVALTISNGSLLAHNLQLATLTDNQPMVTIPEFNITGIDFDWAKQKFHIASIASNGMEIQTALTPTGELTILPLFELPKSYATSVAAPAASQKPLIDVKPWAVSIDSVALEHAKVTFNDLNPERPLKAEAVELHLNLAQYTLDYLPQHTQMSLQSSKFGLEAINLIDYKLTPESTPMQGKLSGLDFELGPYHLSSKAAENQLARQNDYTGAQELSMQLEFSKLRVQEISLTDFRSKPESLPLQLKLSALNFDVGPYELDSAADKLQVTASNGAGSIQDLQLLEQGAEQPLMATGNVVLQGAKYDLESQQLHVDLVEANNGSLRAWLDTTGLLNYQGVLDALKSLQTPKPLADERFTPVKQEDAWPVDVTLAQVNFKNYRLDWQDFSKAKPIPLLLSPLELQLQQVNFQPGRRVPFYLKTQLNSTGNIAINGQTVFSTFATEAQIQSDSINLVPFQPYVQDYARVDLIDATLSTSAKVKYVPASSKSSMQLNAKGSAGIQNLVLRDQIQNKDLLKWRALHLDGLDFDWNPLNLSVGHVLFQEPYSRITIKKDRTLNFDDILLPRNSPPATTVAENGNENTPSSTPLRYQIKAVTFAGGSSDFSDFSLILPFVVQLNQLNGSINSISSEQLNTTEFSLLGKVFDLAPMEVKGNFVPDLSNLDVAMRFNGMPLPFMSPYMVEFAGYKIESGKITLDLLYKVINRQLSAQNNMLIDQLTLGERVENPKATSLPLDLAISLLKDANGKIMINMPVQGSLDDPQFSVGPLLGDALANVLMRVVTSPFTALGSLMAENMDMSKVSFREGSEGLGKTEIAQLDEIAKGLSQKPQLKLEIKGLAYEKEDWPALQPAALLDQLKTMKAAEIRAAGKEQLAEYVNLTEEDAQRLLADLFIQRFPHLAKRSFLGKPELINSEQDFTTLAKRELTAIMPPNKQKLLTLADNRARAIAQYLIQKGGISHERLYILQSNLKANAEAGAISSELALKVAE